MFHPKVQERQVAGVEVVDAIVQVGTHLSVLRLAAAEEQRLGKPVLSWAAWLAEFWPEPPTWLQLQRGQQRRAGQFFRNFQRSVSVSSHLQLAR